ncbi:unnamed protein product, partial [Rotaria sp. Silwood1]
PYKPLTLTNTSSATTPPYLDPTTGALIAIVSNPHHAALRIVHILHNHFLLIFPPHSLLCHHLLIFRDSPDNVTKVPVKYFMVASELEHGHPYRFGWTVTGSVLTTFAALFRIQVISTIANGETIIRVHLFCWKW